VKALEKSSRELTSCF